MKFILTISKVYDKVAVMKALRKDNPNLSLIEALSIVNNLPYKKIYNSNHGGHLPVILSGIADCTYERSYSIKERISLHLKSVNKKALNKATEWRDSLPIYDRICHEYLIQQAINENKIQ